MVRVQARSSFNLLEKYKWNTLSLSLSYELLLFCIYGLIANLQMVWMITLLLKGKRFRESGKNKNKFLCFEQLPWRILYISTFNALKWCITGRFSIGIVSESSQSTLLQWPMIHIYIDIEFVPWSQNLSLLSVFSRFSS